MSIGSKCKLTVTPEWAYGEKGTDNIPPNATLTYVLKLFGFKNKLVPRTTKTTLKKVSFNYESD
jgi:hypothetical protein